MPNFLEAFIDLGPSSIRFSINSLDPKHARILPCVFQDKASIALTDGERPIPAEAVKDVLISLLRFRSICSDYGVSPANIQLVVGATLRDVPNLTEVLSDIERATGWTAHCFTKEVEYGAGLYGIASSFHSAHGLYLKLGSSYIHLNWISATTGEVTAGPEPFILPYGMNTLVRRLKNEDTELLAAELEKALKSAVSQLNIPQELATRAHRDGGHRLYISGNAFRPIGDLLIDVTPNHPIPIINGWGLQPTEWLNIPHCMIRERADGLRRTSEWKANSFLAVSFLLTSVVRAIDDIRKVMYDQSSLREGILFHQLSREIRRQDPLVVASQPYALPGARKLAKVLMSALPADAPETITCRILPALANSSYIHSSYPKELQASLGLAIATTGVLCGAGGLSHETRALIGLALMNRWGGEVVALFRDYRGHIMRLPVDLKRSWWALYLGHVMYIVGGAFPGARVRDDVVTFSVRGTAQSFTLIVKANENSIYCNNVVVVRRLNGLAKRLRNLAAELPDVAVPVNVSIEWVNGPVRTGLPENGGTVSQPSSQSASRTISRHDSGDLPPITAKDSEQKSLEAEFAALETRES